MTEAESHEDAPSEVHEEGQDLRPDVGLAAPLLRRQLELLADHDGDAADGEADRDDEEDGEDLRGQELHVVLRSH